MAQRDIKRDKQMKGVVWRSGREGHQKHSTGEKISLYTHWKPNEDDRQTALLKYQHSDKCQKNIL